MRYDASEQKNGSEALTRTLINTGSPMEAAIGYSRAVVDGEWCWVSGTTGYDYAAMTMPADVAEQAGNALFTIRRTLEGAGFAFADIVRVRYYVTALEHWRAVAPLLGEAFAEVRPAATMIVAGLLDPAMKIEIEATARRRA